MYQTPRRRAQPLQQKLAPPCSDRAPASLGPPWGRFVRGALYQWGALSCREVQAVEAGQARRWVRAVEGLALSA